MLFAKLLPICLAAACAVAADERNDTSADALMDALGNVGTVDVDKSKAEPPSALPSRVAEIKEKLMAAWEDGSLFEEEEDVEYEDGGFGFLNSGSLLYTSKGMVNTKEEMPAGVPAGFPLIERASNALAYAPKEDSESKEKKYIKLYRGWRVLDELAFIHYGREEWMQSKDVVDMGVKMIGIMARLHRDEEQRKQAFDRIQYELFTTLFKLQLHTKVIDVEEESPRILKKLIAYEMEQNLPADYAGHLSQWVDFYRPGMKKRGIEIPHNVKNVPDDVLLEHFNFVKYQMKRAGSFDDVVKDIVSTHGRSPDPNFNMKEFYAELLEADVDSQEVESAAEMATTPLMKEMFPRMNSDGIKELREYMKEQEDLNAESRSKIDSWDETDIKEFLMESTGRDEDDEMLDGLLDATRELKELLDRMQGEEDPYEELAASIDEYNEWLADEERRGAWRPRDAADH
ncbi:hypothetical protein ACHAXT_006252 [Thalassiosira profunda]